MSRRYGVDPEGPAAEIDSMARTAMRELDSLVGCAVTFVCDDEAGPPNERQLRAYLRRISRLAGKLRANLDVIRIVARDPKLRAALDALDENGRCAPGAH